jgi:transcriptional regulator of heat shock response
MRYVDTKKREDQILNLLVESYIEESRPISSSYLQEKFNLSYSSATIRNVMLSLENQGFLYHVHTSSGKVPTKAAFRHYVEHLQEQKTLALAHSQLMEINSVHDYNDVFEKALDILSDDSGYTSMIATWGFEEKLLLRGMRFIFEQPEFEDIEKVKSLFYALEVKMNQLQKLLFGYIGEDIKILIGDEIGFDEIADCSLLISGVKEDDFAFALGLLGPMRMNYSKAVNCLQNIKCNLEDAIKKLI